MFGLLAHPLVQSTLRHEEMGKLCVSVIVTRFCHGYVFGPLFDGSLARATVQHSRASHIRPPACGLLRVTYGRL